MAAFGLTLADFEHDVVEIWPDHYAAFSLFNFLATQWRVSANGPSGLDYAIMYRKMDRMNLSPSEYDQMEEDITVMERAALAEINSGQ